MSIAVTPLSDALGAAITGVDLSQDVDAETVAAIKQAWLDNVIIVFPGQDIIDDEQEKFCRNFGELELVRTTTSIDKEHPSIMMITNVKDSGKPTALEDGEMMFHYDQCYYEQPSMGSTLYAIEVPDEGGNTLFANCIKAYEALSDDWKQRLEGLKALNYYDYARNPTMRPDDVNPDVPQWTHPVVRVHPETGKKAIYVNRLMSILIEGLSGEESDEILNYLFDHIEKPEFVYEHVWTVGDMMMWDNRCSVHARTYFSPDKRRMMRRVTVRDAIPFATA
ncbi:MAG: TauD/TfdA family dioxygenase [Alphaproteobacteria bacterium]|nr:TauD/TfdA family dioxygenase [Alphaproteobacteria bacterium]